MDKPYDRDNDPAFQMWTVLMDGMYPVGDGPPALFPNMPDTDVAACGAIKLPMMVPAWVAYDPALN